MELNWRSFFRPAHRRVKTGQGAFPESFVRLGYCPASLHQKFGSKYVRLRKGLKGRIKLDTSELAFFCVNIDNTG